jgi:4-alpha-glucanotransferase
VDDEDLDAARLVRPLRGSHAEGVRFGAVIRSKNALLNRAFRRFQRSGSLELRAEFERFRIENSEWLDDFSLFMALKHRYRGSPWPRWPQGIRWRSAQAVARSRSSLHARALRFSFAQMVFHRQWQELRTHARQRGLKIIGDLPIFAAADSSDVWAHRDLFRLDQSGRPAVEAGVPPDYFSPTGQLWGNPLYSWPAHRRSGYMWWRTRLRASLQLADMVRLDHFRGFASCWQIPARAKTAESGRWVAAPAQNLLDALVEGIVDRLSAGFPPLLAEDLGVVTPAVVRLRDRYKLPGMKVLQLGFAGLAEEFLPHRYVDNCVAYTGTHDNNTSRGWYESAPASEKAFALTYLKSTEQDLVSGMIHAVWASVAGFAIAPMQDLLDLGSEARMNYPGRPVGNWQWRLSEDALTESLGQRLWELNSSCGRCS